MQALEAAERHLAGRRQQLEAAPAEAARLDREEVEIQARVEASQQALKAMEVRRQALNLERKDIEQHLVKFKTQQMQVKKQEEFEALNREIEHAGIAISQFEDQELTLMMEQDEARVTHRRTEAEAAEARELIARERELLAAKTETARAELAAAEAARAEAAAAVPADILAAWEGVRRLVRRGPWLVQLGEGHRCGGCHLRVSNEITEQVQRGLDVVICDQCGRMLC